MNTSIDNEDETFMCRKQQIRKWFYEVIFDMCRLSSRKHPPDMRVNARLIRVEYSASKQPGLCSSLIVHQASDDYLWRLDECLPAIDLNNFPCQE